MKCLTSCLVGWLTLACWFVRADASTAQAAFPPDLRAKVGNSKAWYLAVKDLPLDQLSALLEESWLTNGEEHHALWQVVRWVSHHDPKRAVTWVMEEPSRSSVRDLWSAAATGWYEKDPEGAFEYFLDATGMPYQSDMLSLIFAGQIKKDAAWVLPHLEKIATPEMQYWVMADHTWAWAGKVPEAATRWITRYKGAGRVGNYVTSAFAQWGRRDPDKAWDFLQTIDEALYEPAANGFARGVMMRDLTEGLSFLDDMENAGLSRRVLDTIGLECGERDPKRGMALLDSLKRQQDVEIFAQAFLRRLAQHNPQQAAEESRRIKDPTILSKTVSDIARAWSRKDPVSAMNWVCKQSDQAIRDRVLCEQLSAWANKNRQDAEKWANSIVDAPIRELALREISKLQ
ncbi:MAG: hypothetical protein WC076_05940 [Terrimicrobiaceae bacterium]|jgi:hypothetical protein